MEKLPFEKIERETLVKKEASTNESYGKKPEQRTTKELLDNGVICLNKLSGPSSHQVADYVKRILNAEKVGHGGTLDPGVTGVLQISLGRATKVMEALLKSGKEYVCLMHIHTPIQQSKIHKIIKEFIGKITQMPPVKSAVKRVLREREIYYLEILEIKDQDVLFRVGCQAGTYIRTLCLAPETELLTKRGIKSIEEIFKNKEKLELFCFRDNKVSTTTIKDFQKMPFKKKLIVITTYSGIKMQMTPDHKLLTSKNEGPIMIKAEDLRKGDFLFRTTNLPNTKKKLCIAELLDDNYLVHNEDIKIKCKEALIKKYGSIREFYKKTNIDRKPFVGKYNIDFRIKHLKIAGIFEQEKTKLDCFKTEKGTIIKINPKLSKELMHLIGLIASDGNNTKEKNTIRHTRIKFSNLNKEIIEEFKSLIKELFPNIKISERIENGSWIINSSNSLLATICANLGVKSPFKENDIKPIAELDEGLIKQFLKGYFDGDGYVNKDLKNTKILYSCINYINIKRIHEMLLKLNIQNIISKRKVHDKKTGEYKDYYDAKLIDPSSKLKFCIEIGSNHPFKKLRLERIEKYFNNIKEEPEDYLYEPNDRKMYLYEIKKLNILFGGNYYRMTKKNSPMTKHIYKLIRILNIKTPKISQFTIDEVRSIKKVPFKGYVYDITVGKDHNFLIENGIVSSNCVNLGKALGTNAHMQQLVRTKAGPFNDKEWYSLQDIKDAYTLYEEGNDKELRKIIKPVEYAVQHLPRFWVIDSAVDTICHGANLSVPGISKLESKIEKGNWVAVLTLKNELVAIGEAQMTSEEIMNNEKGLSIKVNKVFMDPETYPHYKREN